MGSAAVLIAPMGGHVLWLVFGDAPALIMLAICLWAMKDKGDRQLVGYSARRAMGWMLAVACIGGISTFTATSWSRPLFEIPFFVAQFIIILALIAVRSMEYGRGRYVVPMIVAPFATMLAITAGSLDVVLWSGVAVVLWTYAGVMLYLQSDGVGARAP